MKFTELELELIVHRLEVPCALAEVFADTEELPTMTMNAMSLLCDQLALMINDEFDPADLNEFHVAILKECIEGSTFVVCAEGAKDQGDISSQKLSSIYRAFDSAKAKIQQIIER